MKILWAVSLALAAVALSLVVVFAVLIAVPPHDAPDVPPLSVDAMSFNLPPDGRKAETETAAARAELARLKPKLPYIVIDTHDQKIYLRTEDKIILQGVCSTGNDGTLKDPSADRAWTFATPNGVFKVSSKVPQPWWRKPDWAFIDEGEPIPKDPKERLDPNMMGEYAMGFGDGYFIHGTIYERLLGINVTHGCVRLGSADLEKLYKAVPIGTQVYIF